MFRGWVLVVAALVAAPAFWQSAQGGLSIDDALIRFLIAVPCVALLGALLRAMLPKPDVRFAPESEDPGENRTDEGRTGEDRAQGPAGAARP